MTWQAITIGSIWDRATTEMARFFRRIFRRTRPIADPYPPRQQLPALPAIEIPRKSGRERVLAGETPAQTKYRRAQRKAQIWVALDTAWENGDRKYAELNRTLFQVTGEGTSHGRITQWKKDRGHITKS